MYELDPKRAHVLFEAPPRLLAVVTAHRLEPVANVPKTLFSSYPKRQAG